MPQIGPAEIIVILLVGMLVFGPSRLPEIGKQVGRAMREVKKFQATVKDELEAVTHLHELHDDDEVATPTTPTAPTVNAVAAPSRYRTPVAASRSQG